MGPRSSPGRQPLTEDSTPARSTAWEGSPLRRKELEFKPWAGLQAEDFRRGASRWHDSSQGAVNEPWLGLGCRTVTEMWEGHRTQPRQPTSFPSWSSPHMSGRQRAWGLQHLGRKATVLGLRSASSSSCLLCLFIRVLVAHSLTCLLQAPNCRRGNPEVDKGFIPLSSK